MNKYTFDDYCIFADANAWLWENDLMGRQTIKPAKDTDFVAIEKALGFRLNDLCRQIFSTFAFIPLFSHNLGFFNLPPDLNCIHTSGYDDTSELNCRRESDTIATINNVVTKTIELQNTSHLPLNYLAIWDEEGDEYACLDMSTPNGEVVVWDFFQRELSRKEGESIIDLLFIDYVTEHFKRIVNPRMRFSDEENQPCEFVWVDSLKSKLKDEFISVKTSNKRFKEINLPEWCK